MLVVQVQVVRMVGCRSGGGKAASSVTPPSGVCQVPATRAAGVTPRGHMGWLAAGACACAYGTLPGQARVQGAACATQPGQQRGQPDREPAEASLPPSGLAHMRGQQVWAPPPSPQGWCAPGPPHVGPYTVQQGEGRGGGKAWIW